MPWYLERSEGTAICSLISVIEGSPLVGCWVSDENHRPQPNLLNWVLLRLFLDTWSSRASTRAANWPTV